MIRRFISSDDITYLGMDISNNMYVYGRNNPVVQVDEIGNRYRIWRAIWR